MGQKTVKVESTAEAYLEILAQRGIDYFFANAGTDFAPLIEAFVRFRREGRERPIPVLVPHENAAVAMAHGYYLVTGRPQVVMVHVNVGTGNAVNGIINAARDNIPILFTAGRSPLTEEGLPGTRDLYIHWTQEAFDQAGIVREYVKWDYELRNFVQLEAVVDRALEMAMTSPPGPVYLTLPREVLAESQEELTLSYPGRRHLGGRCFPDPKSIEDAARIIGTAQSPLIITSNAGRDPAAVGFLVELAEKFAVPVVEFNRRYVCFPSNHPMHLGFTPKPFLKTADAVLVIESDVPWYPALYKPPEGCRAIHMGIDPLYSAHPLRSFPADLTIRCDPVVGIPMLTEALLGFSAMSRDRVATRFDRYRSLHEEQRMRWREGLRRVKQDSPLDPAWISHCINRVKDEETIIVNEYDLVLSQLDFTRPGTFFGTPAAGGLGWGLGSSLGIKLGAPDRLVIAVLGDGSYMFGNPTPCHFVSRALGLPILTVIFNNGVWNAVRSATRRMYPQGRAVKADDFPLTELEPSPDYEMLVKASGGYGERVEEASQVVPALERAVRAVREEGRQAVLNMVCERP